MAKFKNTPLSEDDLAAFKEAVRGVKPLKQKNKVDLQSTHTKTHSLKIKRSENRDHDEGFEFSDYEKLPPVTSEETIYYAKSGIQHKMLRKLRQGQYNVEATLDLHGNTADEARELLSEFLLHCRKQGLRHILIIHGKGRGTNKPILKNKLNHWLRQTEQVIAFCSATAKDGCGGALYVLLRRESFG